LVNVRRAFLVGVMTLLAVTVSAADEQQDRKDVQQLEPGNVALHVAGDTAWLRWRLVQLHYSVPAGRQ
jgi:hypothetical protein